MTAPNVAAPVTPPAPVAPDAKALAFDPVMAMEATIEATLKNTREPEPQAGERPRDPTTGKFVKQQAEEKVVAQPATQAGEGAKPAATPGVAAPGEQAAPPAAEGDAPEGEEPVIPEGFVAAPPLDAERAKNFKVRDKDGEILPPDLTWEFTANGQPRALSTDKLIAYAQMGVYNHEREQRYQSAVQDVHRTRSQMQELEGLVSDLQARFEHVMASDENYLAAQSKWAAENTPEMRLERERQARRAAEEQVTVANTLAAGEKFFTGTIQPGLQMIGQSFSTVAEEELGARLLLLTEHLRVPTSGGLIYPVAAYEQIQRVVTDDLVPWARQLHEHRLLERGHKPTTTPPNKPGTGAPPAPSKQEADEALRIRAQKARRAAAAASRPATTQPAGSGRPQPPKVRTNRDAEAAVIGETLAAIRAG